MNSTDPRCQNCPGGAHHSGGRGRCRHRWPPPPPVLRCGRFASRSEGVQTTTWTESHRSASMCDPASTGSGKRDAPLPLTRARDGRRVPLRPQLRHLRLGRQGARGPRVGHAPWARCRHAIGPEVRRHGRRRHAPGARLRHAPLAVRSVARVEAVGSDRDQPATTARIVPPYALFENCPVIGDAFPQVLDAVRGKADRRAHPGIRPVRPVAAQAHRCRTRPRATACQATAHRRPRFAGPCR